MCPATESPQEFQRIFNHICDMTRGRYLLRILVGFFLFLIAIGLIGCEIVPKPLPIPPFRQSENKNVTPTYEEVIRYWNQLDNASPRVKTIRFGLSDDGEPLTLVLIGKGSLTLEDFALSSRVNLLVNNGIHPGEPDGIDASMMWAYDVLDLDSMNDLLDSVNVVIIPVYNIGGAKNRNSHSRTNQNGPEAYGFRGNAQNLDLNRDFVKCDSRNAKSFAQLITLLDPDLYVETHVSNGADYTYTMTYLSTQEDKIGPPFTSFLRDTLTSRLNDAMSQDGEPMSPYVNVHGTVPDSGFATFYDSPRYSTGYLALRQIPGYITETHMLKPYDKRVNATYLFLKNLGAAAHEYAERVQECKSEARAQIQQEDSLALDWELDSSSARKMLFQGYRAEEIQSELTGGKRLRYDRTSPTSVHLPYYQGMRPTSYVKAPKAYLIKSGYYKVVEQLAHHGVHVEELARDTLLHVNEVRITSLEMGRQPYEGHYPHSDVVCSKRRDSLVFQKGDFLISTENIHRRLLVELLTPEAPDSYFVWNFFDAVLQQKEWYSAYVFEDLALEYLEEDTALRERFEEIKELEEYRENPRAQLYWLYKQTPHYEKAHMLYPVYEVVGLN